MGRCKVVCILKLDRCNQKATILFNLSESQDNTLEQKGRSEALWMELSCQNKKGYGQKTISLAPSKSNHLKKNMRPLDSGVPHT